jgi:hypothetical protein
MLVPEVTARRVLREHRLRFSVLAPFGAWIGHGTLRVLRLKVNDDESADLTVGYESYERLCSDGHGAAAKEAVS